MNCPFCGLELKRKENEWLCKFCGQHVSDIDIYKKQVIDGEEY